MSEINITAFPHVTALEKDKKVEYDTPVQGTVTGEIPAWIKGSWYRNGPGIIHFKDQSVTHWFDGMALPRRFHISNGEVTYRSRYVRGQSFKRNTTAGRVVVPEFGTHVQTNQRANFLSKAMTMIALPEFTDNCLINFMLIGEYLFAISETNLIRRIDPETLETLERVDISKYVPINLMSSNPLIDSNGTVFNFTTSLMSMGRTKYNLVSFPKPEPGKSVPEALSNASCIGSIDSLWRVSPSYHHSFAMTDRYATFVEMPLKLSIPKMAVAHWSNMCYSDCMESHPKLSTNIYVVDKEASKVLRTVYVTDPVIVYQHINAYEEEDHIVLDVCCFDSEVFFQKFSMKNLSMTPQQFMENFDKEENRLRARRFVLPLNVAKDAPVDQNLVHLKGTSCTAVKHKNGNVYLTSEVICEGADYPAISSKYIGKPYRYFYSAGGEILPPGDKLVKVDIAQKTKVHTWQEKGCWASCPAFIPRPGATEEDDGVLLSSVHREGDKPFLLVLDGKTFEEKGRATFDANIPPDLHGLFVSEE